MKKLILLFFVTLILITTSALCAHKSPPVTVLSTKSDIFYFKVDKTFLGAVVEVYTQDGEKIFAEIVVNRTAIVDFKLGNPGTYTIRLKKDGKEENFNYIKIDSSDRMRVTTASISSHGSMIKE